MRQFCPGHVHAASPHALAYMVRTSALDGSTGGRSSRPTVLTGAGAASIKGLDRSFRCKQARSERLHACPAQTRAALLEHGDARVICLENMTDWVWARLPALYASWGPEQDQVQFIFALEPLCWYERASHKLDSEREFGAEISMSHLESRLLPDRDHIVKTMLWHM